jgi:phosphopantothenoylcysteine decarboxylase/phosphopantothenate--cysteine ligase
MSVLSGKKIILGVSGGIAAYKSASLVRLFIKAGAQVQVIMTPASLDFVTPLTLSTLSILHILLFLMKKKEMEFGIIMLIWHFGLILWL